MITFSNNELLQWRYYIELEKDLENIARYIEFSESNMETYSLELAKLLMAASAEVDVVLKLLCRMKSDRSEKIGGYRKCIREYYSSIITEKYTIPRFSISSAPWENWNCVVEKHPIWWTAYNKTKHERNEYFDKANLRNTINALGGLLIALVHYYKNKYEVSFKETTLQLLPGSSLIRIDNDYYNYIRITN